MEPAVDHEAEVSGVAGGLADGRLGDQTRQAIRNLTVE